MNSRLARTSAASKFDIIDPPQADPVVRVT